LAKPFTQAELLAVVARAASRRTTTPSRAASIDSDTVEQLVASVGETAFERLLDPLALRLEALLRQLEDPTTAV